VIPLLDDHAHPFPLTADELDLSSLTLSVGAASAARRREAAPHRLMLETLRHDLAGLLGCTPDEVLAARREAATDWPGYVRRLFDHAGITGVLLDGGTAPLDAPALDRQAELAGVRTWSLLRIESVIDPLLAAGADGPTIETAVAEFVATGAAAGAAGLKSVVAYRTGLAVDPTVTAEAAYRSVEADAAELPVPRRAKALRDHLLRRTLAQCADLGLPIQFHTGFGDSEIRLADARPVLLDDLLRTPEGSAARVVLIHGGFPWHEELAYLTLVRDNVWAEYSLANLFSPATTADRLLRLLDLAPTDRVLFGTDGHGSPETHWFAARTLRRAWERLRQRADSGASGRAWWDAAEQRLFHGNAEALYPLTARG
jgi:hypothetical protein